MNDLTVWRGQLYASHWETCAASLCPICELLAARLIAAVDREDVALSADHAPLSRQQSDIPVSDMEVRRARAGNARHALTGDARATPMPALSRHTAGRGAGGKEEREWMNYWRS
jgi:hypothetical protein